MATLFSARRRTTTLTGRRSERDVLDRLIRSNPVVTRAQLACSHDARSSSASSEDLLDAVGGSGFEIHEQRDANQDEYERNDPAGDERDLDERRRSVLAICGDLFQACCLRPRMTDEASDFGLDDLAGLEFVSRPVDVVLGVGHAAYAAALNAASARCADRNCPALSSAAAASSRIGW